MNNQKENRENKKQIYHNRQKIVSECTICISFRGIEGEPGTPPPLFFILEIPSRTLTAEIGLHLLTPADLLVASGSVTDNAVCITMDRTWFALQRPTFHFSFSLGGGGGGAEPIPTEGEPLPKLPMYPPKSALWGPTPPGWLLVDFWTRHWKLASLTSTAITPHPPPFSSEIDYRYFRGVCCFTAVWSHRIIKRHIQHLSDTENKYNKLFHRQWSSDDVRVTITDTCIYYQLSQWLCVELLPSAPKLWLQILADWSDTGW